MNSLERQRVITGMISSIVLVFGIAVLAIAEESPSPSETYRIPASTGYAHPILGDVKISAAGVQNWKGSAQSLSWFVESQAATDIQIGMVLQLPAAHQSTLVMNVDGQQEQVTVSGADGRTVLADFGEFHLSSGGYHELMLESRNAVGAVNGHPIELVLGGSGAGQLFANRLPRRNAASVHLRYPLDGLKMDPDEGVSAFYCEVTAVEDPIWTYYMACGWHRGYFGMQVNSPSERRIIFSVWDSGSEAIDRNKVADRNRVRLIAKGDGVYTGDFGNEGTGGHSHLKYPWKTGQKQRFLVTAETVSPTETKFSGYYDHPDQRGWMLISSWVAPHEGKGLRGLYSFSENFMGINGHRQRKALFGNQWIRTRDGRWMELTKASFSCDPTGTADRKDRFGGIENETFFLSHGGFVPGFTTYGETWTRKPASRSPAAELEPLISAAKVSTSETQN